MKSVKQDSPNHTLVKLPFFAASSKAASPTKKYIKIIKEEQNGDIIE